MPSYDSIIAVALAGFALSATPGPSMLYVLSRTVGQSRGAGLASALGLCLGGILLAIATAFGLAAVFAKFTWVVDVLRVVGSAYIFWLGVGLIRDAFAVKELDIEATMVRPVPLSTVMRQGILVELLNPKTVLFFALFLPPFVSQDQLGQMPQGVILQLLVLGVLVPLTAVPSDLAVAFIGGSMTKTLNKSRRARQALSIIGGAVLVGIAVMVLLR